jgi:hypothetical protein
MLPMNAKLSRQPERRRAKRQAGLIPLSCEVIDPFDESVAPAVTWNISATGVCMVIERHYPPGRPIEVAIQSSADIAPVHQLARVVHALEVPSVREMWLTGCSFDGDGLAAEELS